MSETDGERIARLEEKMNSLERRLAKLEANQKWGVTTILGLVMAGIYQVFTTGGISK